MAVFTLQVSQLFYTVSELSNLSESRKKLLEVGLSADGVMASAEESKSGENLAGTFSVLSSDILYQSYLHELKTAFLKNRAQEAELKAPKSDAGAE